jgi:hypothetical protein
MRSRLLAALAVLVSPAFAAAQTSAIPALSSRPGAAYTIYLDFGGFNFTGTWGGTGYTSVPGSSRAYTVDGDPTTFNATEVRNIREIWSRTAEAYAPFNVNVTTVDPAAAGLADAQRQAFYDNTPRMMHTVIGGDGGWTGGAGGISYLGVTAGSYSPAGQNGGAGRGFHTNFVFSDVYYSNQPGVFLSGIALAAAHENGHGLNLDHQSAYTGTTLTDPYDRGDGATGPIMGAPYGADRGQWRIGPTPTSSTTIQNDVRVIQANAGIRTGSATGYVDSGNGHTRATAAPLPLTGATVDFAAAKGVITPLSSSSPNPLGEGNYTTDFFRLTVTAGATGNLDVTVRSGRTDSGLSSTGSADPGGVLDATFRLLDANGNVLAEALGGAGLFSERIARTGLTAGDYYLQVSAAGASASYYDMGSYFLTGTFALVPVPEPGLVLLAAAVGLGLRRLARRRAAGGGGS